MLYWPSHMACNNPLYWWYSHSWMEIFEECTRYIKVLDNKEKLSIFY